MTDKHQIVEEPCEAKVSSTVLKTNASGDTRIEFNQKRVSHKSLESNNWRKAQAKVARFHEHISNTRKDFHFKTAHHLCNQAGMIFAEDLNLKAMSKRMLCRHTLDTGFGQFFNILEWVCQKRDVYFAKVDANFTSQICPNCQIHTGKKELSQRIHECECGYKTDRDVAAAQVVMQRGADRLFLDRESAQKSPALLAVGQTVLKLAEGKDISFPATQESLSFRKASVARLS